MGEPASFQHQAGSILPTIERYIENAVGSNWETLEKVACTCRLKGSSDACYGARIDGSNHLKARVEKGKVMRCDALRTALIP